MCASLQMSKVTMGSPTEIYATFVMTVIAEEAPERILLKTCLPN